MVAQWAMPQLVAAAKKEYYTPAFLVTSGGLYKNPFPAFVSHPFAPLHTKNQKNIPPKKNNKFNPPKKHNSSPSPPAKQRNTISCTAYTKNTAPKASTARPSWSKEKFPKKRKSRLRRILLSRRGNCSRSPRRVNWMLRFRIRIIWSGLRRWRVDFIFLFIFIFFFF